MTFTMLTRRPVLALSCIVLSGLIGCGGPPPPGAVYVERGPPPERVDVIGPSPGRGYVWVGGFYRWDGTDYDWEPGRWVMADRGNNKWHRGRWVHDRRGWYFNEGHWR